MRDLWDEINDSLKLENRFGYQDREVTENTPDWGWSPFTVQEYKSSAFSPALHFNSNDTDWMFGFDLTEDERRGSDNQNLKQSNLRMAQHQLYYQSESIESGFEPYGLERAKFYDDFDQSQNESVRALENRDFGNEDMSLRCHTPLLSLPSYG